MFTTLGSAFSTFNYWFIRDDEHAFSYGPKEVFLSSETPMLSRIAIDYADQLEPEIKSDFDRFLQRPESTVGEKAPIVLPSALSNNQETMIDAFENRVVGAILIRALKNKKDPDAALPTATRFLEWLRNTDFYTAPGSTKFHDADPCGLLFHTLNVYNNIVELRKIEKFQDVDYTSMTLVSLFHDLTKIGNYESFMRNVKNEETGIWEKVPAYRWKCNPFPFGHGVASMYLAMQFVSLSIDELLAIRWHMAEYRVAKQDEGELEDACERYPIVRMIQFADQLACSNYFQF